MVITINPVSRGSKIFDPDPVTDGETWSALVGAGGYVDPQEGYPQRALGVSSCVITCGS
jgi:hypothetical protein